MSRGFFFYAARLKLWCGESGVRENSQKNLERYTSPVVLRFFYDVPRILALGKINEARGKPQKNLGRFYGVGRHRVFFNGGPCGNGAVTRIAANGALSWPLTPPYVCGLRIRPFRPRCTDGVAGSAYYTYKGHRIKSIKCALSNHSESQ